METPPEYSVFVGDLAPEVTDQVLQQLFATHFPSTLGAKVRRCLGSRTGVVCQGWGDDAT